MSPKLLKPRSYALHIIGHGDHSSKNSYVKFLGYSKDCWRFIGMNKIFYHNRLRAHEVVKIITDSGGKIEKAKYRINQKDLNELKKLKLEKKFTQMTPRQLAIYRSELLIRY